MCDHNYQPYFTELWFPYTRTAVVEMFCTKCGDRYTQSFCPIDN